MVRRIGMWVALAVLGLSALAWAGSYGDPLRLPLPGGRGLRLDDGAVYHAPRVGGSMGTVQLSGIPLIPGFFIARGSLVVPLWVPVMVSAFTLWLAWRIGHERRQLALVGHCSGCGYDLTGIDGVCPECGREREREA